MLTISLWQPHGSLLFITNPATGKPFKLHETRSWPPPAKLIGQHIGIHAAKNETDLRDLREYARSVKNGARTISAYEAFRQALSTAFPSLDDLPLGCLIGTAVLVAGHRTESRSMAEWGPFGDFSPGRWAWELADQRPLAEPVPWRGAQGFFSVPDEMFGPAASAAA